MATSDTVWSPESELALYLSMVGLRPVGIHRPFRVLNIYTRLQHRLGKTPDISLKDMKSHIGTLYNIPLLDEIEDDYEDDEDAERDSSDGAASKGDVMATRQEKGAETKGENSSEDDEKNGDESDDNAEADSTGEDKLTAHLGARSSLSGMIPASSIGATLDTSDPQFWRKKSVEFSLPWAEFGTLMIEKAGVGVTEDRDDLESVAEDASDALSLKVESPEPEAKPETETGQESSDGRVSPVARKRRGRSSTPVQRSRPKATRSTAASARKRQKTR
ncbi:hypothetical protein GGH19_001156 [Coemansia sp. RSA 1807]|nr:hypothetical protein LPJ62_001922 [Coemansia sp. RSA 2167]KAJ2132963.1 hypothetical protein GGF48_000531 [Coemansia sp. RSA 921]KAJ2147801.1 hypothetical protein IW142_001420 [Coemansia sp. RSA 564]KAJ2162257.1 hypothetical protein GGH16_005046 [Coemansia sp. RSA 560]KAJ2186388.1 hypothetical protein EV181_003334 [Coemansia sp. RSA 532]KAJ2195161.1 hypothetical protein IW144_003598 [Coemansia sp. RSA 522]KAJ2207421.1 hypothetical protein IW143_004917 [Coemansia sp. RSA 520]KAJ2225586.1 hy